MRDNTWLAVPNSEQAGEAAINEDRGLDDGVFSRPRVLIIDDDRTVREMLRAVLTHSGFHVIEAASGEEAVDAYQVQYRQIDLVLLDVRMPGMDGPATLKALQKIDSNVRCCFISGESGGYTVKDLLALGAVDYLPKPFLVSQITALIRKQLVTSCRRTNRSQ